MPSPPEPILGAPSADPAGAGLRQRIEALAGTLAETLGAVVAAIPGRGAGPQMLARAISITPATASRLLKALSQSDPIALVQGLPGPKPLSRILEAARERGVPRDLYDGAREAVEAFDELIRTQAGDRSALRAMLTAWLPEERREFEASRRQAVFKAMCELEGVSCDLELNAILLHPGDLEGHIDLVDVKTLIHIDRLRPDAIVKVGTRRLPSLEDGIGAVVGGERHPTTLDGEPALDGLHSVRLDRFCEARPAPLVARRYGDHVEYSLGPTGFGPQSRVDLVLVEVNRNELRLRDESGKERLPYFFTIPEMVSRRLVFDVVVHRDLYQDAHLELLAYDTSGRGPAQVLSPDRELDRRPIFEEIEHLGTGLQRLHLLDFPRYVELQRTIFAKLDWEPTEFRSYRVRVDYPLTSTQVSLAFLRDGDGTRHEEG